MERCNDNLIILHRSLQNTLPTPPATEAAERVSRWVNRACRVDIWVCVLTRSLWLKLSRCFTQMLVYLAEVDRCILDFRFYSNVSAVYWCLFWIWKVLYLLLGSTLSSSLAFLCIFLPEEPLYYELNCVLWQQQKHIFIKSVRKSL